MKLIDSEFEVKIGPEHPSKRQDRLSVSMVSDCQCSSPCYPNPSPPLFNICGGVEDHSLSQGRWEMLERLPQAIL